MSSEFCIWSPPPSGNLGDISQPWRRRWSRRDFIAAEDTRVSVKLLNHLGLKSRWSPITATIRDRRPGHFGAPAGGESCALVTDARMPAISDPGRSWSPCAAHGGDGDAYPGALRFGDRPGGLRPAYGPVYLEGFSCQNKRTAAAIWSPCG